MNKYFATVRVPVKSYDIYEIELVAESESEARARALEMIQEDNDQEGVFYIGPDEQQESDYYEAKIRFIKEEAND